MLRLARVARAWNEDGALLPERVELARFILQCGLARCPGELTMLLALANLALEVREQPAKLSGTSRTF